MYAMTFRIQRRLAASFVVLGLLVSMMSVPGNWGRVYGQSAGVPPIIVGNVTVTVTLTPPNPAPGQPVQVQVTVTNSTGQVLTNVVVTITFAPGTNVQNATSSIGEVTSFDNGAREIPVRVAMPNGNRSILASLRAQLAPATAHAAPSEQAAPSVNVKIPRWDPGATAVVTADAVRGPDASIPFTSEAKVVATQPDGTVIGSAPAVVTGGTGSTPGNAAPVAPAPAQPAPEQPAPAQNPAPGTTGSQPATGNAGGAGGASGMPAAGADGSTPWPLAIGGLLLVMLGGFLWLRTQRMGKQAK
jgi:hypothetical protein